MHLKPVFLLAPKPEPPTVPSRRAFLIAGGTFFAGAALGGACGYAAGSSGVGEQPSDPFVEALKPTGDANLDALRNLAVKGSIDELVAKWFALLSAVNDTYPDDTTLWFGARRICDEIISNDKIRERRQIAGWAIQVISFATSSEATELRPLLNELRLVR